jgi:hypothetical protein
MKSYSGFGVKPQAGKPFVGKTMPAYTVETTVISSDPEASKSAKPPATESADGKEPTTLFVEDTVELVHPPPPNPVNVFEQLSAFSAVTSSAKSSESKLDSSTSLPDIATLATEANLVPGDLVDESLQTPEPDRPVNSKEEPEAVLVSLESILELDERSDDDDSKAVLAPPPEPEAVDIVEQLSAFSVATAATETVDRKRPSRSSSPTFDASSSSVSQSTGSFEADDRRQSPPASAIALAGESVDVASPEIALPSMEEHDPNSGVSVKQVLDLMHEARALADKDKVRTNVPMQLNFPLTMIRPALTLQFAGRRSRILAHRSAKCTRVDQ